VDLQLVPEKIETLGIVGAGLMGRSIAETCLKRGIDVVLLDAADGLAASVAQSITQSIDLKQANLTPATDYAEFANCQLVIESVVETIDVKKIVLEKIEAAVSESTIIASNTSAIPISKLGEPLRHPERFCGIHFCHPELMSLVEVISGDQTSEQTISTAVGFVRSLRKMPVAINDGPGFIVNRLLAAMIGQAIRLFAEGVSITAIDEAMREFGFLGGPFEIIDVIGADTCMYAGRTMWESGLNCVTVSPVLPKMVKSGRLGRKSDHGFYHYDAPKSPAVWNDDILELIGQYRESDSEESSQLSSEQIANQILSVMVLEATNILEEEIAADFRDLDLSVIHGFSFPKHQGGILFWADRVSLALVQSTLEQIGATVENIRLNDTIKAMADSESTFYS
jgi:3-hydroxyacyl-CoA dehydrogenase/enoyl-CoA hydratase/3-hydroxybutyryl-CoA epimerase